MLAVPKHPEPPDTEYETVWFPSVAVAGSNVVAGTPSTSYVPPAGEPPVNVITASVEHTGAIELMLTDGPASTTTSVGAEVALHVPDVTVTE